MQDTLNAWYSVVDSSLSYVRRACQGIGAVAPVVERPAHFYTIVTRESVDQTFAANRQRFLTEQGYQYEILY
jgi:hypothetical protein